MTSDTAGVDPADAVAESGVQVFIWISYRLIYSFTLAGASLSFAYDGTSAGRDTIAAQLQST